MHEDVQQWRFNPQSFCARLSVQITLNGQASTLHGGSLPSVCVCVNERQIIQRFG